MLLFISEHQKSLTHIFIILLLIPPDTTNFSVSDLANVLFFFLLFQCILTVSTGLPSPSKGVGTRGQDALWGTMKARVYFTERSVTT